MTAIFNFNGHDLRTIEIEGEPWFCGADVLTILYGQAQGKAKIYRHVDESEKRKVTVGNLSYHNKPAWIVSESGLYKLIMRSDKDTARPFQDWVTKVVLPSIRKTGGYQASAEQPMDPLMQGLSQFLSALLEQAQAPLRAEVVSLRDYIEKQNAMIEKLVSGEEPADIWLSGHLVTEMTDKHLANAIRWARQNHTNHDVLIKERARRNRTKRAA